MTTTHDITTTATTTAVDGFLAAVTGARIEQADVWAEGAVLDATVPNWRFGATGPDAIRATYATWFAHPARFADLRRLPTPGGEVVEYTLCWEEDGVPHAAHHAHLLTLDAGGRIAEDHVFCGGRWDAALLAEMQAAADG